MAHGFRCLAVVIRKNFLLKGRAWISTALELVLPVALMGLIIWIRTEIETTQVEGQSYIGVPENNPTWFSPTPTPLPENLRSTLGPQCLTAVPTGLCPEIFANTTWVQRKERYLGVAVDGLLLLHMSQRSQKLGIVGSGELADFIEGLPGYSFTDGGSRKTYVMRFDTLRDLQNYVGDSNYGFRAENPQLFGAIEVRETPRQDGGKYAGNWEAVIHLNATGPGTTDPAGSTNINTRSKPRTSPLKKDLSMSSTRVLWSGGLFTSGTIPLATGGFVDLQTLFYAWIYNSTGAFTMPPAEELPKCECFITGTKTKTEDMSKCNPAVVFSQVLTPWWSTSKLSAFRPDVLPGCYGRFSGLFPVSMHSIPMPTVAHIQDAFAQIIVGVFGLFFTLLFLWPLTRIMKSLTEDKEGKINEVMKMMGMPAEAITVGWYVTYGILWLIPAVLIPAICWTTVFKYSNKFIVFLFFWLFGVCVITFCSLLSVFFEKAKTASVIGALLFFLLYFPYIFINGPTEPPAIKALASLCPPVALSLGAALIAELESSQVGVQFGNLFDEVNNFTVGYVLLMMVADTLLFSALAWYLDKVLVVGFGTREPPYFCCLPKYWRPTPVVESQDDVELADWQGPREPDRSFQAAAVGFDDAAPGNPRYEPVPPQLAAQRSVLLRGIKKFFTTQDGQKLAAVQGLTLNLYAGQIFVLLGHNGAGKSTTINMLSGMLPVDEGDALMYGKSVKRDMASIRKFLGVCPQHDVIWPDLTVKEHLEFYARVKGVAEADVAAQAAEIVADTGLQEKVDSRSGTLSGGQKRRLSAGIALIGGSQVVFLDEPSSGVDPFSRRELWDCLKAKKVTRTIIMTTHFMDEAEELGDRIAIMAAGQIKCVGSSLFLKAQYGVGYTLTITKRPEAAQPGSEACAQLRALIGQMCPSALMLSDVGVELVYRMPMEESRVFPGLFEQFEKSPEALGVQFFSVSVTTLEEVFLRVGHDADETTPEERFQSQSFARRLSASGTAAAAAGADGVVSAGAPASSSTRGNIVSAGAPPSSSAGRSPQAAEAMKMPLFQEDMQMQQRGLFFAHIFAMLTKRFANAKRDQKAWCCQVGVPLIFLAFALFSLKFTGVGTYPLAPLSLDTLPGSQTVLYAVSEEAQKSSAESFMKGFGGSSQSVNVLKEDQLSLSAEDFDRRLVQEYYRGDGKLRYGALRFHHLPDFAAEPADRTVNDWVAASYKQPGQILQVPLGLRARLPASFAVPVGSLWDETVALQVLPQAPPLDVPLSELNNRLQVDMFWNSTARDAVPIMYHELNKQVLKAALGEQMGSASVKVGNQPFPLTASQKDLTDTQTSLFLALGFAFIPASYGAFVVLERENNSKHLQIISGVNFVSYWLSTWLWDVLNYLVPATLSVALIAAFGIDSLISADTIAWTILAILFYGLSCTSFTYMLSFLFDSHTSAQNLLLVIYLFTGGILQIVAIVLAIIPSTKELLHNVLIYLFRLLPNFALADSLTNLIIRSNIFIIREYGWNCATDSAGQPRECKPWDLEVTGYNLIYMGAGCVVWFLITLVLELALATPKFRALFAGRPPVVPPPDYSKLDRDVLAEKERVMSGSADGEMVVVKELRKVYPGNNGVPPKVAIQGVSFAIPEGECFGYLGVNGAGKTTTMKILTGEELGTDGHATLGGFDIATQQQQVRQLIGYCPQFDALIGTLTAREHLMLFARIKGVPAGHLHSYVDAMLDKLTLTPYADRQSMTFSGGTKRKLSLGIALIGNPRIVFLDEPTTGVDPESRRFMWTLISSTMQGRSVILTTHSMDECEALCARIGIMMAGQLVCLGSAAHLKAAHGAGYQFDLAFQQGAKLEASFQKLLAFVRELFPHGAHLKEGSVGSARLKLRLPKGVLPISALFRAIEERRAELELAEYSVSETTLDQIFIGFAKQDGHAGEPISTEVLV